jgi:hypothetical protein
MSGLMKRCKLATLKAKRRLSKAEARKGRSDQARVDRALRLLRIGVISRARKALESKKLGDMSDVEILRQLKDKFPPRSKDIQQNIYIHIPTRRGSTTQVGQNLEGLGFRV